MKDRRLIDVAFPIEEASIDSVHEKTVRHGHIASLHLWPARRPLAACRAALVATLMADPILSRDREDLLRRLAGRKVNGKTSGGILHWGNEANPNLGWFRERIREAFGGRAPRVLDPFAGGGAIPIEAMRLGCLATAADINPVAWFILKCTLEYTQRYAGKTWALPAFVAESPELVERLEVKSNGGRNKPTPKKQQPLIANPDALQADLAGHVIAWGWWVLQRARTDLVAFYPVIDGKETVAYLWARTAICKNCRASLPLLKTRWLCKTKGKRVILTMTAKRDRSGVTFGIDDHVPQAKGSSAQKRQHDKKVGGGTMSRAGATCPCCGVIMTMKDLRREGMAGRLGTMPTAVAVATKGGKEFRLPVRDEMEASERAHAEIESAFSEVPFGLPEDPVPINSQYSGVANYGFRRWRDLFTARQLLAVATLIKHIRAARVAMAADNCDPKYIEALTAYLACGLDRLLDFANCGAQWKIDVPTINHSFARFALPISWDFAEGNVIGTSAGSYSLCYERISTSLAYIKHLNESLEPNVVLASATQSRDDGYDVVITDPPYYDAIPYANIMDFFYIWLRRTLYGLSTEYDQAFALPLSPKWDYEHNDGELVDDPTRFGGDGAVSKKVYEDGMYRAFKACDESLLPNGRFVIVFAHKKPDAWEALVAAIIRAGFVVDASWPIQTEQATRMRALSSAALSSSVWLVCRKRADSARPGWDADVLSEMYTNIMTRLREFWDAGIRGPDFVWSATGPALEAYSKHPVVKKADDPGQTMSVSEFLAHVRRIVVDFVVGRVLSHGQGDTPAQGLDDVTTYYLLHRNDFKMDPAPVGACILYAISCNLRDSDLTGRYDLLLRAGARGSPERGGEEPEPEATEDESTDSEAEGSGNEIRLKPWHQRRAARDDGRNDAIVPLIDRIHRIMFLWRAGDADKVNDYLSTHGMWHNAIFHQVLQALIELVPIGEAERSLLESISNHVSSRAEHIDLNAAPMLFN